MGTLSLSEVVTQAQRLFRNHLLTKPGMPFEPGREVTIKVALQITATEIGQEPIEAMLSAIHPIWHRTAQYYLNFINSPQFRQLLREVLPTEMADWEEWEWRRQADGGRLDLETVFFLIRRQFSQPPDHWPSHKPYSIQAALLEVAGDLFYNHQLQLDEWLRIVWPDYSPYPILGEGLHEIQDYFVCGLFGKLWAEYRDEMITMLDAEAKARLELQTVKSG